MLVAAGCGGGTEPAGAGDVLFIGNSLTSTNDLPSIVQALAAANGRSVRVGAVTVDGFSLQDHWFSGNARAAAADGWTFVVMQQGPSGLPSSRALLVEYATRFGELIREANGTPALYMVWPDASRLAAFDSVSDNYRAAADAADGIFLPAGNAWLDAWAIDPSLALYGSDGFHPSAIGSYLAAVVIYAGLFDGDLVVPDELELEAGFRITLQPGQGAILQAAALAAVSGAGTAAVPR